MKLLRYGPVSKERPAVLLSEGKACDVSSVTEDFDEAFFEGGGLGLLRAALSVGESSFPLVDVTQHRLGSPVARPSKIVAIGLNYEDHVAETGSTAPKEPKLFMKATSALCGVFDEVRLPRGSQHTDYEVELAVVIGRRANYVSKDDALDYVAGYTICNDYSERDFQKNRSGQFVKGKSADTFAPLGPYLVTPDELNAHDARLWCAVNGEMRQDSRTSHMTNDVAALIENVSQYMTLLPGDVITTGTPAGVGLGRNPPTFLRAGDRVTYGIEGIGEADQLVVATGTEAPGREC